MRFDPVDLSITHKAFDRLFREAVSENFADLEIQTQVDDGVVQYWLSRVELTPLKIETLALRTDAVRVRASIVAVGEESADLRAADFVRWFYAWLHVDEYSVVASMIVRA